MPIVRYFVERLTAHSDVWMVKFDDEEHRSNNSAHRIHLSAMWVQIVLFFGLCVSLAINSHSAANL